MKTKLYPYQRAGVDRMKEFGRALLADEMGLGKGVQFLSFVEELDALPCLIVCPAGLKVHWKREVFTHIGLKADVLSGRSPRVGKRRKTPDVTIVNYDILKDRMEELLSLKCKSIAADEGHYLQTRNSRRTKCVKVLFKSIERAAVLTGTPVCNKPADLWPILNILRPELFPSFMSFCQRYATPRKNPWGWTYGGAKNLKELHALLGEALMVRRLKSEVMGDLPAKRRIIVPLELEDRKQYEAARSDFRTWLARTSPDKLSGADRVKGLAMANHLKQLVGRLKLPAVLDWADDFLESSGEKLILFAYHRAVIEGIKEHFGKSSVMVYGGLSDKKRQAAFDGFNRDRKIRVLAGQIESAGQGWSCTSTSYCAFAELDWRSALITQACDRTHGVGRGAAGASSSYLLLAEGSIEETLAKVIDKKQKIASEVIDGGEGETMDIFAEFCRQLRR